MGEVVREREREKKVLFLETRRQIETKSFELLAS